MLPSPHSSWRDKKYVKPVWVLLSLHVTQKPPDDGKRPRLPDGRVDARGSDNDYLTLHLFDASAQADPKASAAAKHRGEVQPYGRFTRQGRAGGGVGGHRVYYTSGSTQSG